MRLGLETLPIQSRHYLESFPKLPVTAGWLDQLEIESTSFLHSSSRRSSPAPPQLASTPTHTPLPHTSPIMAESEIQHARRMSADQTISKSEIPLKERFFRYFQHEITGKFLSAYP